MSCSMYLNYLLVTTQALNVYIVISLDLMEKMKFLMTMKLVDPKILNKMSLLDSPLRIMRITKT